MAVVGVDGDQRPGRRCGGDQLTLGRQEQPIGIDDGHGQFGRDPLQRSLDTAAAAADVVRVHRLGEHQVGVRVEPPAQLVAVVLQVGLHRVPAAAQRILVALAGPAEPGVQFERRPVGGVRDLSGHRHPGQAAAPPS